MGRGLGRSVEGKEVKPGFTHIISIFTVEVVRVFDYFDGFPDGCRGG
jgi:hypothetical protein